MNLIFASKSKFVDKIIKGQKYFILRGKNGLTQPFLLSGG